MLHDDVANIAMHALQDWNFKASDLNFARSQLKDQSEYKFDPTRRMSGETKYGVSPNEMAEISSSIDKYKQAYDMAFNRVKGANAALDKSLTGFIDLRDQALKTAIDGEWFVVKRQRGDEELLKAAKGSCDVLTEAFQLAHQYKYHIDVKCDPVTMQLSFDRPNRGARPTTMC